MGEEPDDPDVADGGLTIDIDPELIAAAMSAVESRAKGRKKASFAPSRLQEETGDPVTVDLDDEQARVAAALIPPPPKLRVAEAESGAPPSKPASPRPLAASPDAQLLSIRLRDALDRLRRAESEVASANADRDALDRQTRELREAVQRQLQDAEAVRARHKREREEAERLVEERILRGLFEVVDNVERGIAHAGQDPARVAEGLQMINEQFQGLLRRLGVERIDASDGLLFDPTRHEALLHRPTGDVLPGCIVEEVTGGFSLRGRMLRPSRVVVASANDAEE